MKYWTLILLMAGGLSAGRALADAPDVASQPATAPASIAATPAANPSTTAPSIVTIITTQPAISQGSDAPPTTSPSVITAGASTAPTTRAATIQASTTQPTTQPAATTGPSTLPSTAGASPAVGSGDSRSVGRSFSSRPESRILPADYMILAERSIFQRGSHVTHSVPEGPQGPSAPPVAAPAAGLKSDSPEESLVFDGATATSNQVLAFVEDRANLKMLMLQAGDAIASGKITGISLDSLDYTTKGQVIHVQIGQNLRGQDAPAATDGATSAASPPSPGTPAPAAPAAAPGAVPPPPGSPPAAGSAGGGSADDIVARLRARRARELGN